MEKKMFAFLVAATAAAATAAASFWIRRKRTPPPVSTLSPDQMEMEEMEEMEQMEQMEMVSSEQLANYNQVTALSYTQMEMETEMVPLLKRRSSNIKIPCRSVRLAKYNQDNHSSYSNMSVSTSCYLACDPRAWILDIYKKNKILPSPCDSEGFVEVSQLAQSTSIPPLASVKPDSEETCDEYMFPIEDLGRKSSEDCDSHTESMGTVSACKIEPNFDVGECEDMTDTMSTLKDSAGVTLNLLKDDALSNAPASLKKADGQHQDNHKREPEEQTADLRLLYQDPQGQIQGPFLVVRILSWYDQGYFGSELPVRLLDAPEGTEFQSLGELMSNLSLRSQVTCLVNRIEQTEVTEHSDDTRGNLEANASIPFTLNGEVLHPSRRDDPFNQTQQRLQHEVSSQMPQFSQPEIFGGVADAQRHEFSVQDAEGVLYMGRTVNSTQTSGRLASDIHDLPQTSNNNQQHQLHRRMQLLQQQHMQHQQHQQRQQQHLMPSHQNQQLNASYLEHLHGPSYQQKSMKCREHMLKLQVERQQHLQQLEQEEQLHQQHQLHHRMQLLQQQHMQHQQQQHQQRQQQHLMSHQNQQLNASYLEHLYGPSHQRQSMIRRLHMLKLQVERQQRLQQLEQEELLHQQHQLHRRMQLLQQQHMQHHHQQQHQQRQQHQLHQQRQQHQLLLEQLLHHKLQDANYGVPHVDPLLGENSIDQILYRQQFLHEPSLDQLIQAKFVHNLQHQNELLETLNHSSNRYMLTLEQQYLLDLQQEQIQSRRFSIASRQQPVMDEERHVGGAWYESGQFISAPVGHHTRSGRPSQLDFVQPLQRNSSFEQPAHVDRNFLPHDRIQKGNFGLNSQSFERSAGMPMPDMDIMNTFARLQGMDLQERYGRTNSPGQMGQLSGNRPQQNWMANQIHAPHLDAMGKNWSEASGQLQNNLTDSQFARLHLAMEKQNREVRPYLSFEDWNQRQSLDGTNEILNHGPAEVLQQKLRLQSSQQLGFAHSKGVDMSRERVDISDLKDGARVKQHGSKIIALNKSGLDSLESGRIDQTEVYVDHGALKNKLPVRHTSFGVAGGGTNLYNYDMGPDCAYVDPMANDRMSGIYVRNTDGSLSSQGVSSELVKRLNSDSFAYSDEMRHEGGGHSESSWTSSCSDTTSSCSATDAASEASCSDTTSSCSDTEMRHEGGGHLAVSVSESSSSGKDLLRFRRPSSCSSNTDAAPEASFMDVAFIMCPCGSILWVEENFDFLDL